MDEMSLRSLIEQVRAGRTSRRAFMQRMLALGLSVPMANQMLAQAGIAAEPAPFTYKPTRRGGGGTLKTLFWQGPTLLNPHFAVGTKDQEGSRIFYEPLANWDADGNLVPALAAEIPSLEGGTLARDGLSVTWKLKPDVRWHDGRPFTADDVVFNWEFAADPATAATTSGSYNEVAVEKLDALTVVVRFKKPTPLWADAFVGTRGMIVPKHLFENYRGAASRDAPANLSPVGTGPYRFIDFKPGDMVRGEINRDYHQPSKPYFDAIEMKGGGDAVSAARAVLQTGEFDFAWNMQVEDEILQRLEQGGKGRVNISVGGSVEHIQINTTDPWTEVDGERSSLKTKHPLLSDPAVRQAISLLVDRSAVEKHIYGRTGTATGDFINNPPRYTGHETWEFSIEKANELLERAGWKKGTDGIRAKDGKQLKFVYQTSINQPRQKTQAIVKQAAQKAGIEIELKAVTASVFFSSDVANPDTYTHFYCDLQMYTIAMSQPDPEAFMRQFLSWEAASKANKWQGRNITRWQSEAFDQLFRAAESELDPVKRAALFIRMNKLVIENQVVVPVVARPGVQAISHQLRAPISGWDNNFYDLASWFREA